MSSTLSNIAMARELEKGQPRRDPRNLSGSFSLADFWAYLPAHKYIYVPTQDLWPASSVDAVLRNESATKHLDQTRAVEQITWVPGEPQIIEGRLLREGGFVEKPGAKVFNRYVPPRTEGGDPTDVLPWLDHVSRIYGDYVDHLIPWFAHRVQRPSEKPNHAIILGGSQGIGKDTIFEPVKTAVGEWNVSNISPHHVGGRFNAFGQAVMILISEARDLGDADRYGFYERLKIYTAAPPAILRIDEKNLREYSIPNICGVVITTNHPEAMHIPPDDRRFFVAWSDADREEFTADYWRGLYAWMNDRGKLNVAAFLRGLDLSKFDAKAPPPKTEAWQRIVDSARAPEDAELADTIDHLGRPPALTIAMLMGAATGDFREWLGDRRNRRSIPLKLRTADYEPVRNESAGDGLWKIEKVRQSVYAKRELSMTDRLRAASGLRDGYSRR